MLLVYKKYELTNDDLAILGKMCSVCKKVRICKFRELETPFCKAHLFVLNIAYKKWKKIQKKEGN